VKTIKVGDKIIRRDGYVTPVHRISVKTLTTNLEDRLSVNGLSIWYRTYDADKDAEMTAIRKQIKELEARHQSIWESLESVEFPKEDAGKQP
jgi:hypothetical protein